MSASIASPAVEMVSVNRPGSPVAAWFLRRPCGALCLTVNEALMGAPGAREWVTSWFRLHEWAQGRPFGVLSATELVTLAPYVIGYQHPARR